MDIVQRKAYRVRNIDMDGSIIMHTPQSAEDWVLFSQHASVATPHGGSLAALGEHRLDVQTGCEE